MLAQLIGRTAATNTLARASGLPSRAEGDVGCVVGSAHLETQVSLQRSLNYTSLVNAFHGHAHNRLCQLDNLTTYVEGLGLKDLEGCKQAFSKSNALASSI